MLTLKEMIQYGDDLVDEIGELEDEITYYEFGSYAYDQLNMEIESLGLKLDNLMKEITETYGEVHTLSFLAEVLKSTSDA
jgi:hypothetical protein